LDHLHLIFIKILEHTYTQLLEQYPFLTYIVYGGNDYIGVVQNVDDLITTIYDYGALRTLEQKNQFIALAETWWWESNRSIPINIFLRKDWEPFRPTLRTFSNKDLEILHGPACSLLDIARKKSKRKSITLVRRLD